MSRPKLKLEMPYMLGEFYTVSVDLENCEVLSSETLGEEYIPNIMMPFAEITNPKMYDGRNGREVAPQTYVRFRYKGSDYIAGPIRMSREGVIVELWAKKMTNLYISRHDPSNYQFDLNFLNNS